MSSQINASGALLQLRPEQLQMAGNDFFKPTFLLERLEARIDPIKM
jgi:hypothetical protein